MTEPRTDHPSGEPRTIQPVQVSGPICEHGEGPVWDLAAGLLRFVDMTRGDIVALDPRAPTDRALERVHVGPFVAALRPRTAGGWIVALERDLAVTEPGRWDLEVVAGDLTPPGIRLNDGGCDPGGGFVIGSMAWDQRPGRGSLYRLAPDRSVSVVLPSVSISNGFCVDPDGRLAYYADTPTGRIDVFDVSADGAGLSARRPFVAIAPQLGWPDGLTVDAEGGVWVALYGGSAVHRYRPDGDLDLVVPIPTPHVTACAFGGPDLTELFITTTQEGIDTDVDRIAGSVFRARPDCRGIPARPFAG